MPPDRSPEHMARMTELARIANKERGAERAKNKTAVREQALARLVPQAIKKLEQQLNCGHPRIELLAAVKLLEFGVGRPKQQIAVEQQTPSEFVWQPPAVAPNLLGPPSSN
jgi:hypothetical protein